jgi:glycosyltransferase involved in cell wall biosynthesis
MSLRKAQRVTLHSLRRNSIPGARVSITPSSDPPIGAWLLIAASSRGATEHFAAEHGLLSPRIFDRYDIAGDPFCIARRCRDPSTEHVAVHSLDWEREMMPQLYVAALLTATGRRRWLIDEQTRTLTRLSVSRLAVTTAAAPARISAAIFRGAFDAGRFMARPHSLRNTDASRRPVLLAIWAGDVGAVVGGSVTHISGVLGGFRRSGMRVGLVTGSQPPPQIRDSVDDLEVAEPEPSGARLTPELARLASNRTIRRAAGRLVARLGRPGLIYQRHAALRTVGVELAESYNAPLVLEWNGSASWVFAHWAHAAKPLKEPTLSLIDTVERHVVRSADLIAAVSNEAGQMALQAGATTSRLITSPNAVDLRAVDSALRANSNPRDDQPLIGWVGSFGGWHGADLLVRAVRHLPPEARVLMIGEGRERPACQRLAGELGVFDRVIWKGRTQHDEALRLLAGCDVLVAPTVGLATGEPFFGSPTKLFEYMALARPIVASRLGQISEILEHDHSAVLVTPGDEKELGKAIGSLLAEPARSRRLALEARRQVETAHTWDHRAAMIRSSLEQRLGDAFDPCS